MSRFLDTLDGLTPDELAKPKAKFRCQYGDCGGSDCARCFPGRGEDAEDFEDPTEEQHEH